MTAMCTGWALGDTLLELRQELLGGYPTLLCNAALPTDCTFADLGGATLVTLTSGVLIVLLLPLTKGFELGIGVCIDTIEDWVETVWVLITKSLATSVMVLWTGVLSTWVSLGVDRGDPYLMSSARPIVTAVAAPASDGIGADSPRRLSGATYGPEQVAALQSIDLSNKHLMW